MFYLVTWSWRFFSIECSSVCDTVQRWNHIEDLDEFFTRIYQYHQRSGFWCMVMQDLLQLLYVEFCWMLLAVLDEWSVKIIFLPKFCLTYLLYAESVLRLYLRAKLLLYKQVASGLPIADKLCNLLFNKLCNLFLSSKTRLGIDV